MRFLALSLVVFAFAATVAADIVPSSQDDPVVAPGADIPVEPRPTPKDDAPPADENVKIVGAIALVVGVYVATRLLRRGPKPD